MNKNFNGYNVFMKFEEEVFKKYLPDYKKLKQFGFKKTDDGYIIEKIFYNDSFKAVITLLEDNKIFGKVYDLESNDEFLPLRVINQEGAFVGAVRESYEELLTYIRDNCFYKNYFVLAQSNRITNLILNKYKVEPEFLWEKYDDTGIFRNQKTDKWFGIIMDIDKSKIEKGKSGFLEVMNVKLSPETLDKTLKLKGFYPAYHMNKKYWITFRLDDIVDDDKIMELVEESYKLVDKK